MSAPLSIWTVYRNPTDYPGLYVARRFELDRPTDDIRTAPSLEALRDLLPPGLYRLPRRDEDEPQIVEIWL